VALNAQTKCTFIVVTIVVLTL